MGKYNDLKQAIAEIIKPNGNQEIDGQLMQNALFSIINSLGLNASFAGVANETTNPGTPDQNVFYIAIGDGNYVNFNSDINLGKSEVALLIYNNNQWEKKTIAYNSIVPIIQGYYSDSNQTFVYSSKIVSTNVIKQGNINIICKDGYKVNQVVYVDKNGLISVSNVNSQIYKRCVSNEISYWILFSKINNDDILIGEDIFESINFGYGCDVQINSIKLEQGARGTNYLEYSDSRVYNYIPINCAFNIKVNDGYIIRYGMYRLEDGTEHELLEASETRKEASFENVASGINIYLTFAKSNINEKISPNDNIIKEFHLNGGAYLNRAFDFIKKNNNPNESEVFKVEVDTNVSDTKNETNNLQDNQVFESDFGRIYLPKSYTQNGDKTRLIIHCHGASQNYNVDDKSKVFPKSSSLMTIDYMLAKGYAVLDVNGMPGIHDFFATTSGNPIAYRSYIKAYKWAIKTYNLYKEIFVVGISAGSIPALQISNIKTIPVIACCTYCGIMDFTRAWMLLGGYHPNEQGIEIKEYISEKYGFIGEKPAFGNVDPCSDEEWKYIVDNVEQFSGWNSYTMGITTKMTDEEYYNILESVYGSDYPIWINSNKIESAQKMLLSFKIPQRGDLSSYQSIIEQEEKLYNSCSVYRKVPLKMFHSINDPIAPYRYSKYYYDMCKRGGSVVELRTFTDGGHSPIGNNISIEIDGISVNTNVMTVEMLDWFQRFE